MNCLRTAYLRGLLTELPNFCIILPLVNKTVKAKELPKYCLSIKTGKVKKLLINCLPL